MDSLKMLIFSQIIFLFIIEIQFITAGKIDKGKSKKGETSGTASPYIKDGLLYLYNNQLYQLANGNYNNAITVNEHDDPEIFKNIMNHGKPLVPLDQEGPIYKPSYEHGI
ncbi:hypothetical protein ACQ4LE_003198 [Meloidogyne hapla]